MPRLKSDEQFRGLDIDLEFQNARRWYTSTYGPRQMFTRNWFIQTWLVDALKKSTKAVPWTPKSPDKLERRPPLPSTPAKPDPNERNGRNGQDLSIAEKLKQETQRAMKGGQGDEDGES